MARKKESKRQDGYYEYKCIVDRTFDNKPIYKSFYSKKSKADARLKAEDYKAELKRKAEEPDTILFKEFAERYLEKKKSQVRASTFVSSYEIIFNNHLVPYFGDRLLKGITKADIESYMELKSRTLSVSTVNLHVSKLIAFFNEAIDNGYLTVNPCRNIKKKESVSSKRIYDETEVDLILGYCRSHTFGLHIHMILSYGMSRSEYLGIKYEDVNFSELTISINKGVTSKTKYSDSSVLAETKNKYRNRVIAISQETADYIKDTVKQGFLFTGSDELPNINKFNIQYSKFMKDMQQYYLEKDIFVPILNIHELRHTRASLWVNQGKNLFAIAEMLGWSDLTMLRKVYGHADIQQLRKELDI